MTSGIEPCLNPIICARRFVESFAVCDVRQGCLNLQPEDADATCATPMKSLISQQFCCGRPPLVTIGERMA